jgi:hypothetical protein
MTDNILTYKMIREAADKVIEESKNAKPSCSPVIRLVHPEVYEEMRKRNPRDQLS